MLDGIIKHVDTRTGEAKCAFVKHKLRYSNDNQVMIIRLPFNGHTPRRPIVDSHPVTVTQWDFGAVSVGQMPFLTTSSVFIHTGHCA